MRRVVIRRPGGHNRLRIESAPDPAPAEGEVCIEVAAIGVNFADCFTRMGLYAPARHYVGFPITPGFEVAGRVAALGAGVTGPAAGTPVVAVMRFNAYATCVCVPREQVFTLPAGWSLAAAAGFPTVFLTAWYALHELARVQAGERVLVHSAAGGVGQALVQLARLAGAKVTGVVGAAHKLAAVERLGAAAIDRSAQDLWAEVERRAPDGFDVVLDANGVPTLRGSYRHLASGGRLVVYGFHGMFGRARRAGRVPWARLLWAALRTPRFSPLKLVSENRSVHGFNLSFVADRPQRLRAGMEQLLAWAAAGDIDPLEVTTYPLDQVVAAHADLESGQTVGKLVLLTEHHPSDMAPPGA